MTFSFLEKAGLRLHKNETRSQESRIILYLRSWRFEEKRGQPEVTQPYVGQTASEILRPESS